MKTKGKRKNGRNGGDEKREGEKRKRWENGGNVKTEGKRKNGRNGGDEKRDGER